MCNECGCEENRHKKDADDKGNDKDNRDKMDNKNKKKDIEHADEDHDKKNTIEIEQNVMESNDRIAQQNSHLLLHKSILAVNIMGSPGAGKTTLIENIAQHMLPVEIAVIQGDLESDVDKVRLEKNGIYTYQINTHSGCHLNAEMIKEALNDMDLGKKKILFIENVGNLVCPANIKIGQEIDIVVSSTTEGSDKPKKYPVIFSNAKAVIISKSDIAQYVGFDREEYLTDIKKINPNIKIFETSSNDKDSFSEITRYLKNESQIFDRQAKSHRTG